MRIAKMVLAVVFCVACFVVAFSLPSDLEGGFFIGAVLGYVGTMTVLCAWSRKE